MFSSGKEKQQRRGPAEATFVPHPRKKTGSTNLPEGTVHVFRDGSSKPTQEELEAKVAQLSLQGNADDSDGIMLGVLAVPSWMNPSDFLEFVAPAIDGIGHLRIIRDSSPNRSIVVMKFLNPAAALEFAEAYNGKPFNSMENLLSSHPSSSTSTRSIPFANPSAPNASSCTQCGSTSNLWICLICGNIGCGRYGQAHAQAHYQSTTHLYALELETQRVWDYAGDGYVHRLIQNKADGKLVELPSAASSINPPREDGGMGPSQADALTAEKIEAIGIEYSYLLTSQLDSQRAFYEEQTTEMRTQVSELKCLVEQLSEQFNLEKQRNKQEEAQIRKEGEERLAQALKEKTKAEHRAEKVTELARKLEKELREERAVSEGMMRNLNVMKEREEIAGKEKEDFISKVRELEDQVRDVMFFLDANKKIEQGGGVEAEAVGGSLEVSPPPPQVNGKRNKRKEKR
ncbi:hypothetical protein NLJ89_g321 [Agrocybe chaxingu]|uniref:UBP-type domain-containing protein n=1 Tax=Agrocybe chaxingu TaxID=84603 RepID=A0A9W8TG65_9AGAR|nr:hypothetical protein NLJ89_g321 [Agrocybe chaxingu]